MVKDIIYVFKEVNPIAQLNNAAQQSDNGNKEQKTPFIGNLERKLCQSEHQKPEKNEQQAAQGRIIEELRQERTCPCEQASRHRNAILEEERSTVPPAPVLQEVHRVGILHVKEVPSQRDKKDDIR